MSRLTCCLGFLFLWFCCFFLLRKKIKGAAAKSILLAFDSSYSGLEIAAGSRSDQAIEQDGHGIFTAYLLNALEAQAEHLVSWASGLSSRFSSVALR